MISAKKHVILAITLAEPGGAQSFVLGFAQWLRQQGYRVTVVAGEGQWLFERCHEIGIPTFRIQHLIRAIHPWHDWLAYRELKKYFREQNPDAIHLNSTKMGMLGAFAARPRRRIAYRIGGWVFLEPLHPLVRQLYIFLERLSARWKDVIVCVHPGDEAAAKKLNIKPRQKIVTVPNGIDLISFDARAKNRLDARTILDLQPGDFVYGTIANFYSPKNLVSYLESCALVHRQFPQARFMIIGDGPERKAIEQRRDDLHLTDYVILAGARDDANQLLSAFDVFVLPSVKEGMPWSLLEAMASALPCVVTNVGANQWMLEDGKAGWIVPPNQPADLADAMKHAHEQKDLAQQKGHFAREIVEKRFPLNMSYKGNLRVLLFLE